MNDQKQPAVDIFDVDFRQQIFNAARNGKPESASAYLHHLIAQRADPIRSTILRLQGSGFLTICKPGK